MMDSVKNSEKPSDVMGNGAEVSGTDLALPDLQDAQLTWHQLELYLNELLAAEIPVALSCKNSSTARATEGLQLKALLAKLRAGDLRSAQLRYHYQAANWIDTLLVLPDGVRLVRMEMQM